MVRTVLKLAAALALLLALTAGRAKALGDAGHELPGLPNLAKMAQNHGYRLSRDAVFAILGPRGMVHAYDEGAPVPGEGLEGDDVEHLLEAALFAQAPPIYGGSDQIQRNIVGERVLGLHREPWPARSTPFRELPHNG